MIELKLQGLSKTYGSNTVFQNLSGSYESTVLGIAGKNGAGKSTLLQCVAGLIKPNSGSFTWSISGEELKKESFRSHIGFLAPYVQLYEELTVLENLRFLQDLHTPENPQDLYELTEQFQATPFQHKQFGDLSTGQQQRAKMAASCIHQPDIVCMDEPGSNMDKSGTGLIAGWVDELRDQNRMVVLASNQAHELDLCDKLIRL